jgi:hypothetical protein
VSGPKKSPREKKEGKIKAIFVRENVVNDSHTVQPRQFVFQGKALEEDIWS